MQYIISSKVLLVTVNVTLQLTGDKNKTVLLLYNSRFFEI